MSRSVEIVGALVISLAASGCAPSLQNLSAGRVGCSPEDILITNRASRSLGWASGAVTWTATCPGGQSYYCSNVSTTQTATVMIPGSSPGTAFGMSSQVTCTPAAAPLPPAAPPPPVAPPPAAP